MTETQRILVDTNVIVYAYEIEVWENMLEEAEIITTTSVVQDEAKFYSQEQAKVLIDLPGLVERGDLNEVDPTASQVRRFHEKFDKFFSELIHEGERDVLAHLLSIEGEKSAFCSADCTALKALAMLGLSELGISLEETLKKIGYQVSDLSKEYTESFVQECIESGKENRIMGRGLTRDS